MKIKRLSAILLSAEFAWAALAGTSSAPPALGTAAPDFHLVDQYEHEARLADYKGKLTLLVSGDRLGSDFMGKYVRAVRAVWPVDSGAVEVVRVANLKAVPGFFHAYVKHQFQKNNSEGKPGAPVLLDWDGAIAKTYGSVDDVTNVYLIDASGVLRYRGCGKGLPEETQALIDIIRPLAANPRSEKSQSERTQPERTQP